MNLGRVFLGLCACLFALLPAALLAQGGRQTNISSSSPVGTGRSVLAQPASSSVVASNDDEELPPPDGRYIGPEHETQLVAPDAFWLDPGTPYGSPDGGDGYFPKGFVEYTDALRHVIGGELLFLHPLNEPQQRVYLTDLLTEQTFVGSTDPGSDLGIRLWLGMEYGWLGYRIRYTHFGNDEVNADPYVPALAPYATTHAFHSTYLMDADVIDFEMTQRFCLHNHLLQGSFGGRYARLERNSTILGYGVLGDGVELSGVATGANELEGAGITFGLNGTSPTGWYGCWSWFWGLRGSVLWADQSAYARTHASAVVKPPVGAGSADSVDQAFTLTDDPESVFIGEAQLGLQYDKPLCCMAGDFFFRVAVEYQHWDTGNLIAGSESFALLAGGVPAFGGLVESSAFAHDGDLDVLGITIGAGLTY